MRVLFFFLGFIPSTSFACSFLEKSEIELFADASEVFHAKVVATQLVVETHEDEELEVVNVTYELIENFKGTPEKRGVVKEVPFGPGNCMLGLLTGLEYVFYLTDHEFVTVNNGSWGFFNRNGRDVKPKLNKLRDLANNGI